MLDIKFVFIVLTSVVMSDDSPSVDLHFDGLTCKLIALIFRSIGRLAVGTDSSPPKGVTETKRVVFLPSASRCILPSIKEAKDFVGVVVDDLVASFASLFSTSVKFAVIVLKFVFTRVRSNNARSSSLSGTKSSGLADRSVCTPSLSSSPSEKSSPP